MEENPYFDLDPSEMVTVFERNIQRHIEQLEEALNDIGAHAEVERIFVQRFKGLEVDTYLRLLKPKAPPSDGVDKDVD